jgi:phosphatidylserine/phosphatidylglycerophosphate/cardiolipin synthase-like enzyme
MRITPFIALLAVLTATQASAYGHKSTFKDIASEVRTSLGAGIRTVPAAGSIDVGFSPDDGAEALVLRVIGSAKQSLRMSAYSLTSPSIVKALIAAKQRGVDVQVVADYKNNVVEDKSGKGRRALNLLTEAMIPTRTIRAYDKHHDKLIVVDETSVQTGSFNYSASAAQRNSENVIVMWGNPALAKVYLDHWKNRYQQGQDWTRQASY